MAQLPLNADALNCCSPSPYILTEVDICCSCQWIGGDCQSTDGGGVRKVLNRERDRKPPPGMEPRVRGAEENGTRMELRWREEVVGTPDETGSGRAATATAADVCRLE